MEKKYPYRAGNASYLGDATHALGRGRRRRLRTTLTTTRENANRRNEADRNATAGTCAARATAEGYRQRPSLRATARRYVSSPRRAVLQWHLARCEVRRDHRLQGHDRRLGSPQRRHAADDPNRAGLRRPPRDHRRWQLGRIGGIGRNGAGVGRRTWDAAL